MAMRWVSVGLVVACGWAGAQGQAAPCSYHTNFYSSGISPYPVKDKPFSAVARVSFEQRLGDGNELRSFMRTRLARSGAGSTFTELSLRCYPGADGQPKLGYSASVHRAGSDDNLIWDVPGTATPNGKVVRLMPAATKLSAEELAAARGRNAAMEAMQLPHGERKQEALGERTILGLVATGLRDTETIPAGREGNTLPIVVLTETWVARKEGLLMLRISDDPRAGRMTDEVEEVTLGEPDPAMFEPPEGYTVKEVPRAAAR